MTSKIADPLSAKVILEENETFVNLSDDANHKQQQENSQQNAVAENTQETTQQQEEEKLSDKYEGKSVAEVARMHQHAEELIGRQGQQLGELRKVVDEYIATNTEKIKNSQPKNTEQNIDIFSEPDKYVETAVENNPKIKQMQEALEQQQREAVHSQTMAKYPDVAETINDQEFINWVKSSPIRQELIARMNNFDFVATDELLGTWKERKQILSATTNMQEEDKKQERKKASTGSVKASTEPKSRKIYRRSDIVNLMIKDPDRYKANIEEFDKAYREGRVK
jgi:hypothetical protein